MTKKQQVTNDQPRHYRRHLLHLLHHHHRHRQFDAADWAALPPPQPLLVGECQPSASERGSTHLECLSRATRRPPPTTPPATWLRGWRRRRILDYFTLGVTLTFIVSLFVLNVPAASSHPIYSSSNNRSRRARSLSNSMMPGSAGTVATNTGLVQGKLTQLPNTNIEVYEFLGIPFAEPPIGVRRFRKPEAKKPWKDILDATAKTNSCPQLLDTLFDTFEGATMWNANTEMSEDCLYLNIWVPRAVLDNLNQDGSQRALHPVFVWIFGGGFTSGSATLDLYDGAIMAGYNNIIVMSMQYRLGALGFLFFDVDEAPGNMGMWDQLLAMKWTCENIHNFGGDCRNTTIFGESAGAASVSLHLLSPYSRDYFQRAIMQSASALSGWAVLTKDEARWRSNELVSKFAAACPPSPSAAAATGSQSNSIFDGDNTNRFPNKAKRAQTETQWKIDCLRTQPFIRLPEEEWGVLASDPAGYAQFPFVPVIDGDFLPRHPRDMIADGQYYNVSILSGFNENEGNYFMLYTTMGYTLFKHPRALNKQMNFTTRVYTDLIRDFFAYYPHFNSSTNQAVLDAIEFQYTPWRLPVITSQDILNAVDAATGDWAFACPVVSWADSYVELPPAPRIPPPGRPVLPPDYLPDESVANSNQGAGYVSNLVDEGADESLVRYVRLKRSFTNGFSYLQQPNSKANERDESDGAGSSQQGDPVASANRNKESVFSSIPDSDQRASKHKVFLYYFSQRASVHPWPEWMGVLHGDEIAFIFGQAFNYSKPYSEDEKMLTRYIMAYWTNFAKYGDPNIADPTSPNMANIELPVWPEYSFFEKTYLELSVDALVTKRQPSVGSSIKAQECAFWHGYLPKLDALTGPLDSMQAMRSVCSAATRPLAFAPTINDNHHLQSFKLLAKNNCLFSCFLLLLQNHVVGVGVVVSLLLSSTTYIFA